MGDRKDRPVAQQDSEQRRTLLSWRRSWAHRYDGVTSGRLTLRRSPGEPANPPDAQAAPGDQAGTGVLY